MAPVPSSWLVWWASVKRLHCPRGLRIPLPDALPIRRVFRVVGFLGKSSRSRARAHRHHHASVMERRKCQLFRRMARDHGTVSATHQEHERWREHSVRRWSGSCGSVARRHEKRATPPKRCSPSHVVRLVRARALLPSGAWPPEHPCRKCLDFQASIRAARLVRARSFARARRPSPVGVMTRRKCHVFAQVSTRT